MALEGTEKQIAWAEQIQAQHKEEYTRLVKDALKGPRFKAHPEWKPDLIKAYEQAWNSQQSAAWWIENRQAAHMAVDDKARALFKEMHP